MEMAGRGRAAVERKHTTAAPAVSRAADGPMSDVKKGATDPMHISIHIGCCLKLLRLCINIECEKTMVTLWRAVLSFRIHDHCRQRAAKEDDCKPSVTCRRFVY